MAKSGRASDQFIVRLPDGLRERIRAAADASGRSMNAEVVEVLEAAFGEPKGERPAYAAALSLPDGVTEEVLVATLRDTQDKAFQMMLRQLGIVERELKPKATE